MKAFLPEQLFTKQLSNTPLQNFIQFPLCRFLIKLIFVTVPMVLAQLIASSLGVAFNIDTALFGSILMIIGATAGFFMYTNLIENRPALELSPKYAIAEICIGLLLGALIFSSVVLVMHLIGVLKFEAVNGISNLANFLPELLIAGFIEEYIIRGIVFKLSEELLGSWIAIIIQAALFGLIHGSNPNATAFSTFAIAVEAGILLVAVYMLTRRLWMAIGLHFAWNWMQGPFFGIPVSGLDINGFLETSVNGPELLTGGAFGAEASVVALTICTLAGCFFLFKAVKMDNNIVKPQWIRKKQQKADIIEDF